jgi:hypothetical protein
MYAGGYPGHKKISKTRKQNNFICVSGYDHPGRLGNYSYNSECDFGPAKKE